MLYQRTLQKEIDYIEDFNGKLSAFEFKWGTSKSVKLPNEFISSYPESSFKVIDNKSYIDSITGR